MKQTSTIFLTATLVAASIFSGCKSPDQKVETAKDKVEDAKEELKTEVNDANAEATKKANAEEWKVFKADAVLKIKENDAKIADLKIKLKKPGKMLDPIYERRIATLEQKNKDLQIKLDNYEAKQSDWEAFKQEFNHDMDEFGQAFKDLTVDNK